MLYCAVGENEAAFSVAPVTFHNRGGESFVVVGTAKGLTFHPKNHEACFLHVYRCLQYSGGLLVTAAAGCKQWRIVEIATDLSNWLKVRSAQPCWEGKHFLVYEEIKFKNGTQ